MDMQAFKALTEALGSEAAALDVLRQGQEISDYLTKAGVGYKAYIEQIDEKENDMDTQKLLAILKDNLSPSQMQAVLDALESEGMIEKDTMEIETKETRVPFSSLSPAQTLALGMYGKPNLDGSVSYAGKRYVQG